MTQLEQQQWLERRLEYLASRPLAQARLLLCSADLPAAWSRATELGAEVERHYWNEFSPYGRGGDFRLVNEVAQQLLQHNRPLTAIAALELYLEPAEGVEKPSAELIATGLEELVRLPKGHKEQLSPPSSYDIQRLLDYLRSCGLDEDRLATLEWQFLPARGFNERSPVLERRLARDPQFFVDIMSLCFRRKDGTIEQEVSEGLAKNAYRLVKDWKIVPGSDTEEGEVNELALMEWVTEARLLAGKQDRKDICDIYIGEVFAQARMDDDGTWPTLPVRNAIEKLASEKIENGFWTGILNKRGVTTRSPLEGGKQEYELADRFDDLARNIQDRWHRTAVVLRSVAETYRAQGRREDEEAERYKRGLER
jgi:hypothetical protein